MTEWQSIKTAPRNGTDIDLWVVHGDGDARRYAGCHWDAGWENPNSAGYQFMPGWYYSEADGEYGWRFNDPSCPCKMPGTSTHSDGGMATHWMPIPDPPLGTKTVEAWRVESIAPDGKPNIGHLIRDKTRVEENAAYARIHSRDKEICVTGPHPLVVPITFP